MNSDEEKELWCLFGGTKDYIEQLLYFLTTNIEGYTLLEGKSGWKGLELNAQVILFFNYQDAITVKKFLIDKCNQVCVPILKLNVKEV